MNKYFKGYITRENAVKVLCRETCHPGVLCPDTYCVEMWEKFEDIPNEDVRPVIRCRDCKHYTFADNRAFGFPAKRCEWTGFEDVDDDDFCSRAERREVSE